MAILGILFYLVGLVCAIIILIDAFKSAVWKGIVGLLCGLYLLYYMFAEFQHEKKWLIIGGCLGGNILGGIFWGMGAVQAVQQASP